MVLLGLPIRISTGFRFISGWASEHLCPGFVEFEISKDVIHCFAGQIHADQTNVLFRNLFLLFRCALQAIFQELAIAVLFVLVVRGDGFVAANRLL